MPQDTQRLNPLLSTIGYKKKQEGRLAIPGILYHTLQWGK